MSSRPAAIALSASLALVACLPSEVDCYVGQCSPSSDGASSGATTGAGGGVTTTACGSFGALRALATDTPPPSAIAVDASNVYWVDAAGARRVDKNASSPVTGPPLFAKTYVEPATDPFPSCVGEVLAPGPLALTSDALVWTLADQCAVSSDNQPWGPFVWVAPKDGSTPWGEGSQERDVGRGLTVDGGHVIIAAYNQHAAQPRVVTVDPTIMNDPTPPTVDTPYAAVNVAVTADDLYFSDNVLPGLFTVPRAGLGAMATSLDGGVVTKVLVDPADGSVVYVSGGHVKRYLAGATTTLASEAAETPLDLALDDACVYWSVASGHVRAVAKSGGEVVEIASAPATHLAVDATGVYLADSASGTVSVVPKD